MQLSLSYTARLNLHFMMGQQRGNVDDIRVFWELQDTIDLTQDEREKIRYKAVESNGQNKAEWDGVLGLQSNAFEFTREQCDRMRNVVKTWQGGFSALDRMWLEPLLRQLDKPLAGDNGLEKQANGLLQPVHE